MTYVLNLLDLLFTLHALRHGGVELNPLMANVPFMVFYKTVVVGVLLWWLRKRSVNTKFLTAVFAAVNVWHIVNVVIAL